MKGSRNSVRMTNNRMVVCGLVIVLILVGLYFLAQRHNLFGVTEGFESQPAELNNLTQKPNPGPNEVVLVLFYVDWCPHCVSTKPEWAKLVEGNGEHGKAWLTELPRHHSARRHI